MADKLAACLSIHAGDVLAVSKTSILNCMRQLLEKKFGAVKLRVVPFTRNRAQCQRRVNDNIVIQPLEHLGNIPVTCRSLVMDRLVSAQYARGFRSILTSVLFPCQCHAHILAEVTQLQGFNNEPIVIHLKGPTTF